MRLKPDIYSVERFVALTIPLAEKMERANANMGKYTIFVNRKHTLAHVCIKNEDMYLRVPIKAKRLHRESDGIVQVYFAVRLHLYLMEF